MSDHANQMAKFMADKIGHHMSEKCEHQAELAFEYIHELGNKPAANCPKCGSDRIMIREPMSTIYSSVRCVSCEHGITAFLPVQQVTMLWNLCAILETETA